MKLTKMTVANLLLMNDDDEDDNDDAIFRRGADGHRKLTIVS